MKNGRWRNTLRPLTNEIDRAAHRPYSTFQAPYYLLLYLVANKRPSVSRSPCFPAARMFLAMEAALFMLSRFSMPNLTVEAAIW